MSGCHQRPFSTIPLKVCTYPRLSPRGPAGIARVRTTSGADSSVAHVPSVLDAIPAPSKKATGRCYEGSINVETDGPGPDTPTTGHRQAKKL